MAEKTNLTDPQPSSPQAPDPGSDPADRREQDVTRLVAVIETASDVIGGAAGGALTLLGGDITAIGGPAVGVAISKALRGVGLEVHDRLLVARQRLRVGATLGFLAADAEGLAAADKPVRTDGFFDGREGERSDAEEVLEGVLLQAANAYQELKLRHLAAILPSVAVRSDVSAADCHWLVRLTERLTWRQLVVIAIFYDPPSEEWLLERVDMRAGTDSMREEVNDLAQLGLLGVLDTEENVVRSGGTWDTIGHIWGSSMFRWRLTKQGQLLFDVARLDEISVAERDRVLQDVVPGSNS